MDPNATLRLIADADFESPETWNAARDLARWLRRGGFEPDWDACPEGRRRFDRVFDRRGCGAFPLRAQAVRDVVDFYLTRSSREILDAVYDAPEGAYAADKLVLIQTNPLHWLATLDDDHLDRLVAAASGGSKKPPKKDGPPAQVG